MSNWASSHYEGLQAKIEKRFGQGLTFRANYAFGKVIDVGGSGFSNSSSPQDPNNMRADRGLSSLDRRNIFSLDWVYQLPFGKGRRFGSSFNGWEDALFGGWEVTGIMTATSGAPFTARVWSGRRKHWRTQILLKEPILSATHTRADAVLRAFG